VSRHSKHHPSVEIIFGNREAISFRGACNRFAVILVLLHLFITKRLQKMVEDHWAAITEKVSRRLEPGTNRRDLSSLVLEDSARVKGLS